MTHGIHVTRSVVIPDRERLALYRRAPELGPRILFFTGGTALRALSRKLIDYTHNSIHIVTPFDSGGSSAFLRKAFKMLAVGDIRSRIMALADQSERGNPAIFELFAHRLPAFMNPEESRGTLQAIMEGRYPLMRRVSNPMRQIIRTQLKVFHDHMPPDFELSGACIGNLILTGGYLAYDRQIDPVVYQFSKLVEARGDVCAVINQDLHLVAELEDGSVLSGQHLMTGKEGPPIQSRIRRVYISRENENPQPVDVQIRDKVKDRIHEAHLVCYPMGSFYSSLVANTLPRGVGDAIAAVERPKVYIPNLGNDPEQLGMSFYDLVTTLLTVLQRNCSRETEPRDLLNFILMDSRQGKYPHPLNLRKVRDLGIEIIDMNLVTPRSAPYLDDDLLIETLLSLT